MIAGRGAARRSPLRATHRMLRRSLIEAREFDASETRAEGASSANPLREEVERARAGDRAAFHRLYETHAPRVHALVLMRVASSDAEDVVQQVFLAAWRGLGSLRDGERFSPWIFEIARRQSNRHLARSRAPAKALDEAQAEPEREPRDELGARVLAHLRALPEAYRETLALRLVEGLSGPEIARACGLTHGSVRVNLTRGMKLLRERLARDGIA